MKKDNKFIFTTFAASTLIASAVFVQTNALAKEREKGEVGSIQLSPELYVPDKELFLNKEVDKEDVIKTMRLEEIKLNTDAALAELDAGIYAHLGYHEKDLNEIQLKLYEDNVKYYSKAIRIAGREELEDEKVTKNLAEFREWVSTYKSAVDKYKEEELETERMQQKGQELKEVKEVEKSTLMGTFLDKPISFEIPSLESQHITYMPYTAITAKNTPHYRLQQLAETNEEGYRTYNGAIAVALGSAYGTKIGTLYDITFSDGKVLRAILGDNKSDRHTDAKNQYRDARNIYDGKSGNIVEMIMDASKFSGMPEINKKINNDYAGEVVSIVKVGMAEGFDQ